MLWSTSLSIPEFKPVADRASEAVPLRFLRQCSQGVPEDVPEGEDATVTPNRFRLASACSAALGALVTAGTVDIDTCAALAHLLREEGIETRMHDSRLRSEAPERIDHRKLPDTVDELPTPTLDEVQRKLGALKVELFIVSTWPWDMRAEYEMSRILAVLDVVTRAWSTSRLPNYPTESMIAASSRHAAESLDLHHVHLLGLLEQRQDVG